MDGQINRNERYKSTRYFYKCKFINVYINSFSIKNNYFKLLKEECTKPSLLKCDLRPGLRVAVANKEKVGVLLLLLLRSPRAPRLIQFCSHPQ